MPGEHGRWLYDMERRAPAMPALRQPDPQHPINCRESEPWTAGTIDHGELVSECDDRQVQRRAGANEKTERVEQRNDDRRHESRLSKNVGNLNRRNTDEVHGRDSFPPIDAGHRRGDAMTRGFARILVPTDQLVTDTLMVPLAWYWATNSAIGRTSRFTEAHRVMDLEDYDLEPSCMTKNSGCSTGARCGSWQAVQPARPACDYLLLTSISADSLFASASR